MIRAGTPSREGYRGYEILAVWVKDHWVFKVFFQWDLVDSFLSLDDAKTTIDRWLWAP